MSLSQSRITAVVAVSDLDGAREFYEEKLGLEPGEWTTEDELVYRCGGGTELIVYSSPTGAGGGSATTAAWVVEDLTAEMAKLRSVGIEFDRYDEPGLKTDENGVAVLDGARIAWFRDPDGNTFAISES